MERECLLVGEKITLKLCSLRILAIEKLEFGKKRNMILILGLELEGCPTNWESFVELWTIIYEKRCIPNRKIFFKERLKKKKKLFENAYIIIT